MNACHSKLHEAEIKSILVPGQPGQKSL
jgi:hypothetical protein